MTCTTLGEIQALRPGANTPIPVLEPLLQPSDSALLLSLSGGCRERCPPRKVSPVKVPKGYSDLQRAV